MPKCVVRHRQTGRYILNRTWATIDNRYQTRSDADFLDINNARVYENSSGAKTSNYGHGHLFDERYEIIPITINPVVSA